MKNKNNYLQQKSQHPKVVAYYFKEWRGFDMPFHSHKAIEIMYVISGECLVEVGNRSFQLKKGRFIFIGSEVPHRLFVKPDGICRMLNLEFILTKRNRSFPSLDELADENNPLYNFLNINQAFLLLRDINGIVLNSLKQLVLELDKGNESDNYLMVHLLLSQLLLQVSENVEKTKERPIKQTDIYIRKVIDYIHENYDYDIKIEELAQLVHLHPNYLHRIFKGALNITIMEYLTNFRIDKAKMLLTRSDIPVTDISNYVGMNSSQYFSKVFKKETGATPIEYRRKEINNIRP
ncbi:AraC family transcriptional regulator [Gracilibacillus salinarum]|uniref:AraC family transcriptional regulator n=1 Tax=Gracilibacillus salinarum TaxID=2932255 RepID=A0ABY4GRG3_9BACI|nr:AraC family transcriptional regulator [Gracilibacillus salinarum]UOQ86978.1 AraC family transcriptional regulator [Gracilibacillus salinarum]